MSLISTVFPRIVSHGTLNETKRIWKVNFSKKTREIWHVTKFGPVWQVSWFQLEWHLLCVGHSVLCHNDMSHYVGLGGIQCQYKQPANEWSVSVTKWIWTSHSRVLLNTDVTLNWNQEIFGLWLNSLKKQGHFDMSLSSGQCDRFVGFK